MLHLCQFQTTWPRDRFRRARDYSGFVQRTQQGTFYPQSAGRVLPVNPIFTHQRHTGIEGSCCKPTTRFDAKACPVRKRILDPVAVFYLFVAALMALAVITIMLIRAATRRAR